MLKVFFNFKKRAVKEAQGLFTSTLKQRSGLISLFSFQNEWNDPEIPSLNYLNTKKMCFMSPFHVSFSIGCTASPQFLAAVAAFIGSQNSAVLKKKKNCCDQHVTLRIYCLYQLNNFKVSISRCSLICVDMLHYPYNQIINSILTQKTGF